MQHTIQLERLHTSIKDYTDGMAQAISSCVHCGFCLPVCPTYKLLAEEMDSPRGRILLMKSVLEGELELGEALPYLDRCLGCLACVSACPSGVQYANLIEPFKVYSSSQVKPPVMKQVQGFLIKKLIPYPTTMRPVMRMGKILKPVENVFPGELKSMLDMIPDHTPAEHTLPEFVPAQGKIRARVALLTGCVQQVVSPEINTATLRVLAYNGIEVIIPRDQSCCGGILMHTGDYDAAREMALRNLAVFKGVDAVISNAAGCGSAMKRYGLLFKGTQVEAEAVDFGMRVKDVSEFLGEIGILPPPPLDLPLYAAYQDACHLLHAQKIKDIPRRLLASIPNLSLVDIEDEGTCCGSAGTYNLEQPGIAGQLGRMKADKILASGADMVVTGNIGCMVQVRKYLSGTIPVYHIMEILEMAYYN